MSVAEKRELTITRTFDAPRELLFALWTDPHHIVRWWGPKHHPSVEMTMDVRPSGVWRACLRSVDDGTLLWMNGVFREVAAPSRLVFTFRWEEEGERGLETVVTVTFSEENGKTRMDFHQKPFQSEEEREGHGEGWSSTFDRLEAYIELKKAK